MIIHKSQNLTNLNPERLSLIDLPAILEHLQHNVPLPNNLPVTWVNINITTHNGLKYRSINGVFLRIHHYGTLVSSLVYIHENNTHYSIGTITREAKSLLSHSDLY